MKTRKISVNMRKSILSFYHGTSSIFIKSIRQYGLGGKNFIQSLPLDDILMDIIYIMEKEYGCRDDQGGMDIAQGLWLDYLLAKDIRQCSTHGLDFRYQWTYLTPQFKCAKDYAQGHEFGSEKLSVCFQLWNSYGKKGRHPHKSELRDFMLDLTKLNAKPVIVKVKSIESLNQRELFFHDGSGRDIEVFSVFEKMKQNLQNGEYIEDILSKNKDFTYRKTISGSDLTFLNISGNRINNDNEIWHDNEKFMSLLKKYTK